MVATADSDADAGPAGMKSSPIAAAAIATKPDRHVRMTRRFSWLVMMLMSTFH
jgi:hypothetical protein